MSGERAATRRKMESFEGMLKANGADASYARAKAREMACKHDDGAVKKRAKAPPKAIEPRRASGKTTVYIRR